jgi:hypothetical protein
MLTGGGEERRGRDLAVEEERGDGEGLDRWRKVFSSTSSKQRAGGGPGSPGPEAAVAERAHQGRAPEEERVGEMLSRRTKRLY